VKGDVRSGGWRELAPGRIPFFRTHSIHLTSTRFGRNRAPSSESTSHLWFIKPKMLSLSCRRANSAVACSVDLFSRLTPSLGRLDGPNSSSNLAMPKVPVFQRTSMNFNPSRSNNTIRSTRMTVFGSKYKGGKARSKPCLPFTVPALLGGNRRGTAVSLNRYGGRVVNSGME